MINPVSIRSYSQCLCFLSALKYFCSIEIKSTGSPHSKQVTKAQFFKVCSNLTKHVTLSALEIMAPNLARRLGKDPELLVASERTITVLGSSPDNPSVISIEDDEDVIALSNEVLTKITPKAGSRSPLRSCDEPSMSSRSSCGKRYVVPLLVAWQIDRSDSCQ